MTDKQLIEYILEKNWAKKFNAYNEAHGGFEGESFNIEDIKTMMEEAVTTIRKEDNKLIKKLQKKIDDFEEDEDEWETKDEGTEK